MRTPLFGGAIDRGTAPGGADLRLEAFPIPQADRFRDSIALGRNSQNPERRVAMVRVVGVDADVPRRALVVSRDRVPERRHLEPDRREVVFAAEGERSVDAVELDRRYVASGADARELGDSEQRGPDTSDG
ncbi:MAG: hypothetical protein R3E97_11660 [Candidatus Eisenbacteria bacterium]